MKTRVAVSLKQITKLNQSFRLKQTLMLLFFAVLPVLLMSLFLIKVYGNLTLSQLKSKEMNIASVQVDATNHFLESKINVTKQIIQNHPEFVTGNVQKIQQTMQLFEEVDTEISYYSYITMDGSSFNSQNQISDIKERDYFIALKETKQPAVSDLLISKKTGKHAIVIAVPVLDSSNNLVGGLACVINVEDLKNLNKNLVVENTGYAMLLSKTSLIMNHSNDSFVGKSFFDFAVDSEQGELDKSVLDQDEGFFEYKMGDAVKIAGFKTVPAAGWKVLVTAPSSEVYAELNKTNRMTFWIIAAFSVLMLFMGFFQAKRVTTPILRTVHTMESLAKGDLTARFHLNRKDELGLLSQYLNQVAEAFNKIIRQVKSSADEVHSSALHLAESSDQSVAASNHIAASIQEIVNGSEVQLRGAEQTSIAIDEMAAGVQRIAESSSTVAEEALHSSSILQQANDSIVTVSRQMNTIQESVDQAAGSMQELQQYSQRINEIVNFITEVTTQTKLLSLNASIEAARAGEHGRGFSVVANEIKTLAEKSNDSTDQIKKLVQQIQSLIMDTAESMRRSVVDVDTGSRTVVETGEILEKVKEAFKEISDQTQEVSAATEQMSAGTEEVNASMNEIVSISKDSFGNSQAISAAAEEELATIESVSSSAKQLKETSRKLNEAIQHFKL